MAQTDHYETPADLLLDLWSPLSYKPGLNWREPVMWRPKGWVPNADMRRLQAYMILSAYQKSVARHFLPFTSLRRHERREYGDASVIVSTVVDALMGGDQSIVVEGAAAFDPGLTEVPAAVDIEAEAADQEEGEDGGTPGQPQDTPTGPTPDELAANEEAALAQDMQDFLAQWAADERLILKMREVETDAVGLGDGVYTLGWNPVKGRPVLRVWDPMFYFPVLSDDDEEFPRKVHIAYELPDPPQGKVRVRRLTWELGPILPQMTTDRRGTLIPEVGDGGDVVLSDGDVIDELGRITRRYPWQPDDEDPSTATCYFSDGVWELDGDNMKADDLTPEAAEWALDPDGNPVRMVDLRLDCLPVIHVPNTYSAKEHFGESLLSRIAQLLDDVARVDTNLQAAADMAAGPVIWTKGGQNPFAKNAQAGGAGFPQGPVSFAGQGMPATTMQTVGQTVIEYGPGQAWYLGVDGQAATLDLAQSLKPLMDFLAALLKRLSVNVQLPDSVMGRVEPTRIPSGIAVALTFGPMINLVRSMRVARAEKYGLLLKFVQKMFMAAGELEPGEVWEADVAFGSYLPADTSAVIAEVRQLLTPPAAISRLTAIAMLIEAGLPIDDAAEELDRIQSEDFAGAVALLGATADERTVFGYLNLPPPAPKPPPPAPVINLNPPPPSDRSGGTGSPSGSTGAPSPPPGGPGGERGNMGGGQGGPVGG